VSVEALSLPGQDARIRAFVDRLLRHRMRWVVGRRLALRGAPCVAGSVALAVIWPSVGHWFVAVVAIAIAIDVGVAAIRERLRLRSALLEAGAQGRGLADMLLAWSETVEEGRSDARMRSWLGDFLGREVAALPAGAESTWTQRGLGAVRYLVPLVVAMLLFWWLRPEVSMPWFGLGGQPAAQGGGGAKDTDGGANGGGAGSPRQSPASPSSPVDTPEPEDPSREAEGPQPQPEPPAPFLDVSVDAQVVVPEFTRDGPTRKALAQQAQVGVEEVGGAAAAGRSSRESAGGQDVEAQEASDERFRRAAERALQDRRVPERERPIVRSFFESLRGSDK
jgi:hypothetical protein